MEQNERQACKVEGMLKRHKGTQIVQQMSNQVDSKWTVRNVSVSD